ncbi:putative formin-like protein 3 isoform X1 [Iris pallida]|uniref:Formin-like protein 3 isoform X1 n=1 Tax=Iris pallida TaxID=29817 RepID=A0AAX6F722_IRIPA|nr:putative formin-like protein 3 isoform X1 [Iris pallida]
MSIISTSPSSPPPALMATVDDRTRSIEPHFFLFQSTVVAPPLRRLSPDQIPKSAIHRPHPKQHHHHAISHLTTFDRQPRTLHREPHANSTLRWPALSRPQSHPHCERRGLVEPGASPYPRHRDTSRAHLPPARIRRVCYSIGEPSASTAACSTNAPFAPTPPQSLIQRLTVGFSRRRHLERISRQDPSAVSPALHWLDCARAVTDLLGSLRPVEHRAPPLPGSQSRTRPR